MRRYISVVICLLCPLIYGGCFERDAQLTEPTGTGTNTLSCRVDGHIWEPMVMILYHRLPVMAGLYRDTLHVSGVKLRGYQNDFYETLDFACDVSGGIGPAKIVSVDFDREYKRLGDIVPDSSQILITALDTATRVASGRFTFILRNNKNGEMKRLTDGRFDVRYNW